MSDTIQRLLAGHTIDPASGKAIRLPIDAVMIAPALLDGAIAQLHAMKLGKSFALVCDANTFQALGGAIEKTLNSLGKVNRYLLPGTPKADWQTAENLRHATAGADVLIAVGSGTINDLTKYAAHANGKPYVVFGTAPSMNGYASLNVSLTMDGHKKSLRCSAPRAVFLDIDVLCAAPPRLIRAGVGDALCRPTAQADWLLSHLLLETPYHELPFSLLKEDEAPLFAEAGGLLKGDRATMERLARTLVLSGIGMTLAGGSYPASQGEHMIAHTLDMVHPELTLNTHHGEQIGITTLTLARIQKKTLNKCPIILRNQQEEKIIFEYFGPEIAPQCLAEWKQKMSAIQVEKLNSKLQKTWPDIAARIREIWLPPATLEGVLKVLDAPCAPADLGWPTEIYEKAVCMARFSRARFTFLDIAL